jgi:GNAT superfamily N-acetyltransferase
MPPDIDAGFTSWTLTQYSLTHHGVFIMLKIRPASADDAPLLKQMILELAEHERERELAVITEADIVRDGFGPVPKFRALIAEWHDRSAGYALFYDSYSTWEGKPALFLEDLFVRSQYRSNGIGKSLLAHVARIAKSEQCYGVRWEVLDWNQPAVDFYKRLGGTFLDQWTSVVLTGDALERVAHENL